MSFSKRVKINLGKAKTSHGKENTSVRRASRDGLNAGSQSTCSQPGTPQQDTSSLDVLADAAASSRAANALTTSPEHRAPSPSANPEGTTSSILGRRSRGHEHEWTPRTKKRLREFASDTFEEFGVPLERRDDLQNYAELPTHRLLIVIMGMVSKEDADSATNKTVAYVTSKDFKDNVAAKLNGMLIDPGMFSYKAGALERALRHIRLNMDVYGIPVELRACLDPMVFGPAVGKVFTSRRYVIKKKLAAHWEDKASIYEVTKDICPRFMEPTIEMWGRVAWLQLQLVDHTELVGKAQARAADGATEDQSASFFAAEGDDDEGGEGAPPDYWSFVDNGLAEIRETYAELTENERKVAISNHFGAYLKLHMKECPVKRRQKGASRLPEWQRSIMKAVAQMSEYTQEDLADEEIGGQSDAPDDSGDEELEEEEDELDG